WSERGIVVLLPQRVPTYPDSSLEDLLGHEVAHVLVARAAGNRPMPRWFHEGVAMIAGLTWGLDDRTRLTYSLVTDREISLAGLNDLFAGGEGAAHRAYAISGAFVRDLLDRHGEDAAARILDGVADGLPFEEAFRRATGVTLAAAESSFWSRQSFWYRWVPLLTSSVTLWLGITLLALYAIKRRRARDAALRRMWDEEEERLRLAREAAGEGGETVH
ncbi:MAG: peptidase MA family metallohydrolase, partial [Thermoanaerobaculia bacterium]